MDVPPLLLICAQTESVKPLLVGRHENHKQRKQRKQRKQCGGGGGARRLASPAPTLLAAAYSDRLAIR